MLSVWRHLLFWGVQINTMHYHYLPGIYFPAANNYFYTLYFMTAKNIIILCLNTLIHLSSAGNFYF